MTKDELEAELKNLKALLKERDAQIAEFHQAEQELRMALSEGEKEYEQARVNFENQLEEAEKMIKVRTDQVKDLRKAIDI